MGTKDKLIEEEEDEYVVARWWYPLAATRNAVTLVFHTAK